MTTHITYKNGRIGITTANGTHIDFRACDLQYEDRMNLIKAVSDISPVQQAGEVGFLKTQPVEERERVVEEILGKQLPQTNRVGFLKSQPVCVRVGVVGEILGIPMSELLGDDDDSRR